MLQSKGTIKNNPLSTSTSKQQWAFSKASRFENPHCNTDTIGYGLTSTFSNKKAHIGSGKRLDYFSGRNETRHAEIPNLSSSLQLKSSRVKNGSSFGRGREQIVFDNYLNCQQTPGPKYSQLNFTKKGKGFTMAAKTNYPKQYFIMSNPQELKTSRVSSIIHYQTVDDFGTTYRLNKNKNNCSAKIGKSLRFTQVQETPGPLDYKSKVLSATGYSFLSNFKNPQTLAKTTSKRQLKLNKSSVISPGPAKYRPMGDFGYA